MAGERPGAALPYGAGVRVSGDRAKPLIEGFRAPY